MKISDSIKYVGVNDHEIDLFEGQFEVPMGMAYNSYVILDDKIAVMDSVDQKFGEEWLKNIENVLAGKKSRISDCTAHGNGSFCKHSGFHGKVSFSKNRSIKNGFYHYEKYV